MAKVWIVYTEYQGDSPGIEGAFSAEAAAEEFAESLRESARNEGQNVYGDEYDEGEDWREAEWDLDVRVEGVEVK